MDTRIEAAERLLNRGVRFRLPASFVDRLLGRDHIDIRPLRPGAILEMSLVIVDNQLAEAVEKGEWEFLQTAIRPVAQCVAIASLGTKRKIERDTERLTEQLLWRIPAQNLVEMFRVIAVQNRVSDFTSITKFLCHQTTMMMTPNLGH